MCLRKSQQRAGSVINPVCACTHMHMRSCLHTLELYPEGDFASRQGADARQASAHESVVALQKAKPSCLLKQQQCTSNVCRGKRGAT